MDEMHAGIGDYINDKLTGLDCSYDEIRQYFVKLNFEITTEFESNKGYHFSIDYYSPNRDIITKILGNHIGGAFSFDKEKLFVRTAWGVSK